MCSLLALETAGEAHSLGMQHPRVVAAQALLVASHKPHFPVNAVLGRPPQRRG